MDSFDYHAELEVLPTATTEEIRASYMRLALLHHPDKNPGNTAAATAKFQRLHKAYEELKKPTHHRQYNQFWDHENADEDGGFYRDFPDFDVPRNRNGSSHSFDFFEELFRQYAADERRRGEKRAEERAAWDEAVKRERQATRAREEKERQARYTREGQERRAKLAAKEAAKQAELEAKQREREVGIAVERTTQEDIWKKAGAMTKDEKLRACLHSEYSKTDKQDKKTKCSECRKNTGVRPFECPYCASFLCHQCQTRFSKRREKATISQPGSAATSYPEPSVETAEEGREACAGVDPKLENERKSGAGVRNGHGTLAEFPASKKKPKATYHAIQTSDDTCSSAGNRTFKKAEGQLESDEEFARRLQEEWNEEERRKTQGQWNTEKEKQDPGDQPFRKQKRRTRQKPRSYTVVQTPEEPMAYGTPAKDTTQPPKGSVKWANPNEKASAA